MQHLFDIDGVDNIAYVEPSSGALTSGRSATWFGAGAFARYQVMDGDLGFELGALITSRRDFALLPRVSYRISDGQRASLGGMLVEGQADGLGGAYSHLDQLYVGYTLSY